MACSFIAVHTSLNVAPNIEMSLTHAGLFQAPPRVGRGSYLLSMIPSKPDPQLPVSVGLPGATTPGLPGAPVPTRSTPSVHAGQQQAVSRPSGRGAALLEMCG